MESQVNKKENLSCRELYYSLRFVKYFETNNVFNRGKRIFVMKCCCFQETPNNVDYNNDFDNWNTRISLDNEEKSPPDQEVSEAYIVQCLVG